MASKQERYYISSVTRAFKEALITKNIAQLILLLGNLQNRRLVNRAFSFKNEPLVQANRQLVKDLSLERFTPLCLAILYNDLQLIDFMLEHGATQCAISHATLDQEPYGPMSIRYTPLHLACEAGAVEIVGRLLNAGFDVDQEVFGIQPSTEGGALVAYREYPSALFLAMSENNLEVMETLLRNGASVEILDEHGRTPLHTACVETSLSQIHLIVQYGGMTNKEDHGGLSPFGIFCGYIPFEVVPFGGKDFVDDILTAAFLLVVASGYNLAADSWYKNNFKSFCALYEEDENTSEHENEIFPKLKSLFCGYCSLKNLCRRVIRQQLYHNRKIRMPMSVDYLPLPTVLKDYVSLKEPVIN